jgi:hypothetical protein
MSLIPLNFKFGNKYLVDLYGPFLNIIIRIIVLTLISIIKGLNLESNTLIK